MPQMDILTTNRTEGAINTAYICKTQSTFIQNTIPYMSIYNKNKTILCLSTLKTSIRRSLQNLRL